jgi:hypothetical protein
MRRRHFALLVLCLAALTPFLGFRLNAAAGPLPPLINLAPGTNRSTRPRARSAGDRTAAASRRWVRRARRGIAGIRSRCRRLSRSSVGTNPRRMNLNDDVVYRCLRLGPLHQRHPGRSRSLVRHHDRLHRTPPCVESSPARLPIQIDQDLGRAHHRSCYSSAAKWSQEIDARERLRGASHSMITRP